MNISLDVDNKTKKVTAKVEGRAVQVISNDDRHKFGIEDKDLKAAVGKYMGKTPDDVYVKSKTPWGDLYAIYHWPQVQTVMTYKHAEVIEFTTSLSAMKEAPMRNNSDVPATFTPGLTVSTTETATSSWNDSTTVGVGTKITYTVGVPGDSVAFEESLNLSTTVGHGGSSTKTITVADQNGLSLVLGPHQSAKATLKTTKHNVRLRVYYDVTLDGMVAMNYGHEYKAPGSSGEHHFYARGVQSVLAHAGKPTHFEMHDDITMTFYGSSETELTNLD